MSPCCVLEENIFRLPPKVLAGLPQSGKKVWKMNFFQVREKSGNFNFSQGNLEKKYESQGKVSEFEKIPKKSIGKKSSENHNFY